MDAVAAREEPRGAATGARTGPSSSSPTTATSRSRASATASNHPMRQTTFVIVDGPQFGDSAYNPEYEIVDVTPTVLSLFGAPQCANCDGVPLTSLRGSDSDPLTQVELQELLKGQIAATTIPTSSPTWP